jgi:glycosyltransferase involved in cell wall biosynthesis
VDAATYSIIIPAYNESVRITGTLDKVLAYIAEQKWTAEVLVVNDGSRDDTAEIVQSYARRNPIVRLVQNPGNRGKGYSVRNGMLSARGDVLLFSDADLSSPIYEAPKLFAAIADGADVAIGSRWLRREFQTERQPLHRQFFGRVFNLFMRLILGLKFVDTQCGFKAFKRNAALVIFPRQRIYRWGFDPEILFLAKKFRLKTREVPVEWAHDDRSKMTYFRDGMTMVSEVLKIRWNDIAGRYSQVPAASAEENAAN